MSVDFIKKPSEDTSPVKLDFYKPEHVLRLVKEIKAGEIIVSEKNLDEVPPVTVVIPDIVITEPTAEEVSVVDTGASEEVSKYINKGRR